MRVYLSDARPWACGQLHARVAKPHDASSCPERQSDVEEIIHSLGTAAQERPEESERHTTST